jgi:predicted dehydrogenase
MSKLRIAVVGPGLIGKKHLQLVHDDPSCCVAAIVAPDNGRHHQTAAGFAAPLYHDVKSMIAAEAIDGVIISSPNIVHVDQAAECLQAGIPVLVEKPIAHTFSAGEYLVEVAAKTRVPLLVGHHRAHSPIMRAAREVIEGGRIGRIVAVMGSALFYKPDEYFAAGPWRMELGGGPILINLIHEIGNLRALCGEIVAIQANSTSSTRHFAVEDTASLNLEFANGALGAFILSDTAASARSWEQTSRENPSYPAYDDEDCYTISGTVGTLAIPSMRLKFFPAAEERSWWKPFSLETFEIERKDPLKCQLENFVGVISGKEVPVVSGYDGLQNLRIVEAVFESIKTKRAVRLQSA